MNILVIGNGFDLAHGLPTKYTDFFKMIDYIIKIKKDRGNTFIEMGASNEYRQLKDYLLKAYILNIDEYQQYCEELYSLMQDNFWRKYILIDSKLREENWIGLENEIQKVIRVLEKKNYLPKEDTKLIIKNILSAYKNSNSTKDIDLENRETIYSLKKYLLCELNTLIRAFEIYIAALIERIMTTLVSPDIKNLLIDKVLSFNYTNTFEKIYDKERNVDYDYIHGKAHINSTIETNNMVLGIDEYLPEKRRNKDVEFIAFKKYYQRIYKQTGCKYKEWVDQIKEDWLKEPEDSKSEIRKCISVGDLKNNKIHNLYIFGHSLDLTDKDILRDLILNDNVHTTIFYHNKDVMGKQIANLVKVIGQDELIKRTGGRTKTIEFKQQQDMVIKSL